ncbi:MAG: pyrroloquinoline quinone biosynthesis peptide chaperone PqqD [Armatimonadetes bacterium]|nr:pyrroloquinoline quinone biosynthesis peptide chaperone PqqD [Armatimonadota bacterium]MDE2206613.1 pyrroloquinoline quinone biosynthesis peptide chaperone PqqD [Armatimonadota bacterium]
MTAALKPRWALAVGTRLHEDRLTGRPVLLYPESALWLNRSAASICALLDGTRTSDDIARELSRTFNRPVDTIAADVEVCISRLRDKGLVTVR